MGCQCGHTFKQFDSVSQNVPLMLLECTELNLDIKVDIYATIIAPKQKGNCTKSSILFCLRCYSQMTFAALFYLGKIVPILNDILAYNVKTYR